MQTNVMMTNAKPISRRSNEQKNGVELNLCAAKAVRRGVSEFDPKPNFVMQKLKWFFGDSEEQTV